MRSSAIWRGPDADQPPAPASTSGSTRTPSSSSAPGSPASSAPTGRGRPRSSRRSPGRCTACRPRAAAGRRIRRRGAPPTRQGRGRAGVRARRRTSTASCARSTAPSSTRTAIRRPIANSIGAVTERVTRLLGHDPRRVLQHLLHRAEGARGHGGDDARPSGPSSSPGCSGYERIRVGAGAAQGEALRAARPARGAAGRRSAIWRSSDAEAARADDRLAAARAAEAPRPRRSTAAEQPAGRGAAALGASCSGCARPRSRSRPSCGWRTTGRRPRPSASSGSSARAAEAGWPRRAAGRGAAAARAARRRCGRRRACSSGRPRPSPRARATRPSSRRSGAISPRSRNGVARLPTAALLDVGPRAGRRPPRRRSPRSRSTSRTQRTAWVRDAQDAKTKRQGLLDQYQELKEQRQRIVKAGPGGRLSHLRPAARRGVREGARAARPADGGGRVQRQLLQAADRAAAGGAAGRSWSWSASGTVTGARAVRGHRRARPARGAGPGGGAGCGRSSAGWQLGCGELEAALERHGRRLRRGAPRRR